MFISFILFLTSLWSKEMFLVLFDNVQLQQSYSVTIVVLCSYMFWGMYAFFVYPLSISNNTFAISKITILAALINLFGNIVFIPYFGFWGSLFVTYVSYFVFGFSGLLYKENRIFFEKYVNITKLCLISFSINIFLFAFSYLSRDLDIYFKFIISIFSVISFIIFVRFKNKFNL
jgi:O-antigen/teichoic acid export membrane protein